MPLCAFRNCENTHRNTKVSDGVSFFRFPSDPFRCAEWIAIVARERREQHYVPFKTSTICSIHFDKSDIIGHNRRIRLLKTAIPKLQIHVDPNDEHAEVLLSELTTTNLFLQLYKTQTCIWNPKHPQHRNRDAVDDGWAYIQKSMPMMYTVTQLKKKKESLMSAYRAYKIKIYTSKANVIGRPVYRPSWFAFGLMDSFLSNVYTCNPSKWTKNHKTYFNTAWIPEKHQPDSAGEDPGSNSWETEKPDANVEAKPSLGTKRQSPVETDTIKPKRHRATPEIKPNHAQPEEDECSIVAKLWANKLRKLPEERRDLMIYKINTIMYKELISHNRASSSCLTQVIKEEPSDLSDNNSCDENRLTDSPITS